MTPSSRNNVTPSLGWVAEAAGGLLAAVRRTRHWLSAFLLRGLDLERLSLAQIRVVGAQLRREPVSTPAKADTEPPSRVALTSGARRALKLGLQGRAKLKNDV
jgi:hypothetical protein